MSTEQKRIHELNRGQRLFCSLHGVCLLQFAQLVFGNDKGKKLYP